MTRFETPRVAVIGTGDIGRGWAALAVASGWPVAIYEAESEALAQAAQEIADRVQALVGLGRADQTVAFDSLKGMRVGRSLLHAVNDADWIIESAPEDLGLKQRLLEQVEQVARMAAVMTSSTHGFPPSSLCARLRRPERMLVAHPINPVELLPVVEVVPGPATDLSCVEDVRFWLSLLGRTPVVLKKEIPGNFLGRINAAVWRECIHLVLTGVLDVDDVDRAMSLGPAISWAAIGPNLANHLAANEEGVEVFMSNFLTSYEHLWAHLAEWKRLDPEEQKRFVRVLEKTFAGLVAELREVRNQRLAMLLEALRE